MTTQPSTAIPVEPPASVSDDPSNEPTRVVGAAEEDDADADEFDSDDAVTETRGTVLPESGQAAEQAEHDDGDEGEADDDDEATLAASPAAFAIADKVLGGGSGAPDHLPATGS